MKYIFLALLLVSLSFAIDCSSLPEGFPCITPNETLLNPDFPTIGVPPTPLGGGTGIQIVPPDVDIYDWSTFTYTMDENATMQQQIGMNTLYPVTNCMDITEDNSTILLTQDIDNTGTCFKISAYNVTIDCDTHIIRGTGSSSDIAIEDLTGNATIINCELDNQNPAAIMFEAGDGSKLINSSGYNSDHTFIAINATASNVTVENAYSYGYKSMNVEYYGQDAHFKNVTMETNSYYNLYALGAKGGTFEDINATTNEADSIYIEGGNNITLDRVNATSRDFRGVYATGASGLKILHTNATNTGGNKYDSNGMVISDSTDTRIENSEGNSLYQGYYGIFIDQCTNTGIYYSTGYVADSEVDKVGIGSYSSDNTLLYSCVGTGEGNSVGIGISSTVTSDTIVGSSGISGTGYGIYSLDSTIQIYGASAVSSSGSNGLTMSDNSNSYISNLLAEGAIGVYVDSDYQSQFQEVNAMSYSSSYGMVLNGNGILVNDSKADNSDIGYYLQGCTGCTIMNSEAINETQTSAFLDGASGSTVYNLTSRNAATTGIYVYSGSAATINRCNITNTTYGVSMLYAPYVTVRDSWINSSSNDSQAGAISTFGSDHMLIANNTLWGNRFGYITQGGNDNTIADNRMYSKYNATIQLYTSNRYNVTNNTLMTGQSQYAEVLVLSASHNNTFWWNNFSAKGGLQFNDTTNTSALNNSNIGKNEGNIWSDIIDGIVNVTGHDTSLYGDGWFLGDAGTAYPYNWTKSGGRVLGATDWRPLTTSVICYANISWSNNPLASINGQVILTNWFGAWYNVTTPHICFARTACYMNLTDGTVYKSLVTYDYHSNLLNFSNIVANSYDVWCETWDSSSPQNTANTTVVRIIDIYQPPAVVPKTGVSANYMLFIFYIILFLFTAWVVVKTDVFGGLKT